MTNPYATTTPDAELPQRDAPAPYILTVGLWIGGALATGFVACAVVAAYICYRLLEDPTGATNKDWPLELLPVILVTAAFLAIVGSLVLGVSISLMKRSSLAKSKDT
ncbi:hypothetical protein N9Y42_09930 [Mariniblastus sp.]|nr:hypothetical protein [Mariniblastus sp.]